MESFLSKRSKPGIEADSFGPAPSRDVAMLAHDIRGALQGVIGGIAQIESATLDPAIREQVERVVAAGKTLTCLFGALMGEEPDQEKQEAHSHVDLRHFLDHLRRRWIGEATEKSHRFEIEAGDDLPFGLRIEPIMLSRVIGNLISNAIHQHSGEPITLSVERHTDGGLAFRLLDSGPGLSAELLRRVRSEVYHATGSTRPAHGLGLHIVRNVTAQMGGKFSISNRSAGGVEAELYFPPDLCVANAPGRVSDLRGAQQVSLTGARVLLAEDNPTNQLVASQMLKALQAQVSVSSDGVEALARFEAEEFDLVIVDIEMPRLSGLDVIRTIRKRGDARAQVPIVALTAYAMREHRDRIFQAGANGLISKPITSIEALGRDLAQHLAQLHAVPQPQTSAPPVADEQAHGEPVVEDATFEALVQAIGPEMIAELLEKVLADLANCRAELEAALDPLDRGPIRAASHILISVAGAVGAGRLHKMSRTLNTCARSGTNEETGRHAYACIAEIDAAADFVRARVAGR